MPKSCFDLEADVTALDTTTECFVEALDKLDNLLRDTIGSKYALQVLSVYTIKGLLEVYKVDVQLPLLLCTLFSDIM